MSIKLLAGFVAVVLMVAYVTPLVFKMKDVPLAIVILIGLVTMLVDLWQSLGKSED